MKKICCFLIAFYCCIAPSQATEFYAKNYIVIESGSGQVQEDKNIHDTQSVASISKIMTAIVAIENDELLREVEIGEEIKKLMEEGYIFIKVIKLLFKTCYMV